MKVNVIQIEDVKFLNRFSWWSKWIDIALYDSSYQSYLIQMKVSRNNKKKFRSVSTIGLNFKYLSATSFDVGDLTQMSKRVIQ